MNSRHRDEPASTRVPPDIHAAAKAELERRGWTFWSLLGACIHAFVAQPDKLIAFLTAYRPVEKPKGRPRKQTGLPPTP